jgi:hypothetical protein
MSDFGLIFQVVAGLLVLFFIYLTWQNTKTWSWQHVTLVFLNFAAAAAFCIYAAQALKTRSAWMRALYHKDRGLVNQVASLEEQLERVTRGDPTSVEGEAKSIVALREALGRTILDRGRVWRQCIPQQANPDLSVVLSTSPPPDPNDPTPPPVQKNNLQPKLIVQAFREGQTAPDQPLLPQFYIGEYEVTAATDTTVTLAPTMPQTQEQLAARGGATWSLYESCPADAHEPFAGVEEGVLRNMIPPPVLQAYLNDGKEIGKDIPEGSVPPESVWYEVRFEKEYEVTVDAPPVNSLDAEPFNTEGQAVQHRLRRGGETPDQPGKVVFGPKEGQVHTAVLDQQTAQSLIDQGVCTLVRKVFRRRLIDYERFLHAVNERMNELNGRLRQLDLDNKAMLAATAKAEQQAALLDELKGKLTDDLAKTQYEANELEKYLKTLSDRLLAVQTELSELYRANKAISRELAARSAELTEEIDRRSRQATAMAPR